MVWLNRVEAYIDDLEVAADGLARQMKQMKVDQVPAPKTGSEMQAGIDGSLAVSVNAATEQLAACLSELEGKVAQRELLLRATDAPQAGLTLSEKLEHVKDPRGRGLHQRCELISEMMADINNHALSLFVCQFHLASCRTTYSRWRIFCTFQRRWFLHFSRALVHSCLGGRRISTRCQ